MSNLHSMLSKSAAQEAETTTPIIAGRSKRSAKAVNEILISAKLSIPIIEYVRDFQHQQAMTTGNVLFSFKDALTSIISEHRESRPNIPHRPDAVKEAESKRGRKKET
jgi:hypothetical protein